MAITNPTASFVTPDAVINTTNPVDIVVDAQSIPTGTTVNLYLLEETGLQRQLAGSLTGTVQSAGTTISTTFPSGHTKGYVTASWGP